MAAEYRKGLCVRGYHVYNDVWEAAAGETLVCVREPRNAYDRYAVAVEKDGRIIGHLPFSFIRRFASAIDDDDNVEESWPRGSGRPSTGRM